ncbi:MAG TPA: taurine catabolism dioxygenase TauD [Rhodospirillaceae bacterium]|nr:taurine catabolism dioxygenase TauD [Rhodospirillaceae bacterium]HAA92309.1 taurine catabolism dioxygenase TauD [Rhodospirillaceae bacterium]HAT36617.1 taurine catabolism dioxygenase TauD [Rhodospirillaceae bacterium]
MEIWSRCPTMIEVVPVSDPIGAELQGVDLGKVDDQAFDEIHRAWMDHCVLLFRGQTISAKELVAFSKRFGDLDVAPPNENGQVGVDGLPEVLVLSNVKENGKAIGALGNAEAQWHSDMNYIDEPPTGSVLLSVEVPDEGGDTGFCNMYRALDDLPDGLREQIDGLNIKHDNSTNSGGFLREGAEPVTDITTCPGAVHPIVRTHPETGRKALYLGRRRSAYIMGLPVEESETLLDELWAHASQPKYAWHHQWHAGDVLMWDNRCTMHRRDSFDDSKRRVMHRTQIKGDKPI